MVRAKILYLLEAEMCEGTMLTDKDTVSQVKILKSKFKMQEMFFFKAVLKRVTVQNRIEYNSLLLSHKGGIQLLQQSDKIKNRFKSNIFKRSSNE